MTLQAVKGQGRAIDALRAALKADAVHHAYLFIGPEGVGKELAAVGLAQALLCTRAPLEGCGECEACGRVQRRNHPDVVWLMPEAEWVARGLAGRSDFQGTPSRELRVEQVRGLQERLSLHALEGHRKLALVASAERMNDAAQNAFLKTLEEPPPHTTLVLIASAEDRLLPTIRSRCARIQFAPLPRALVAQQVAQAKGLDAAQAEVIAAMSEGSLARASRFEPEALARREALVRRFEGLGPEDVRGWLGFAEAYGGSREDAEETLDTLGRWIRDVAVARVGGGELLNPDLAELAATAAARHPGAELARRRRLLEQARIAIASRNGSPRLQLERLLIELGGAR
jgi:DNA polymerase III subunit delta'